jgi:hypothetical protein
LHILGHKHVHHAYELYAHPEQCRQWVAAWKSKVDPTSSKSRFTGQDWDRLLAGYTAVTDMPSVCFARELIQMFPEAKVVLTVREEQAWLKSFKTGVIDTCFDNIWLFNLFSALDFQLMRPLNAVWICLLASKDGYFGATSKEGVAENALEVYRKHNALVRDLTPHDRLLEFKLADGWKPLCDFLEVEVPDVPFPRVNEGDAIKGVLSSFMKRSMLLALRNVAVGIACAALASRYFF